MLDNNGLIATAVDPSEIAQLADEDLALAIVAEKKLMEGMAKLDARAWIDKKTRILQQSMMALKTIRNNLADVDNLPDEILVEIFRQLAFVDRPFFAVDPIEKKSLKVRTSWLAVARVCRRWRNIALDTPKLYSIIDARNTAITRMFLKRSRNIPVDIYMQSISLSTNVDGIMTEIMPHFSRVREFQFRARYQSMLALMSHIESLAAPMLETLHLEQTAVRRMLALNEAIVIHNIFGSRTPTLRRLYLAHISIPWTSPIYAGLTELHLLLQHPSTSPSVGTFVRVLENCPLLEALTLVRAGPSVHSDLLEYPPPLQTVELAPLLELYLQLSRPIDTQYVIAHLVIPPAATITVFCQLDSDQDFSAVLPRDCDGLKGFSHIRRLRLYVEDVQSIILTGYTKSSAKVLNMSLFIGESEGMLKPRLFFSQLEHFFPLSQLEDLQVVNCAAHISSQKYIEVLSKLSSLTHLTASEVSPARQGQLLTALSSPLGSNEGVVCPSLKVLRLSGLDGKEVIDDVARTCQFRASKGSALDAVHIADLGSPDVLALVQVVSIVDINDHWVEEVGW